jgi:hypothetical protein
VSKQSLPTVAIPARLEKVTRVAAEHGDADAPFLPAKVNRANLESTV